MQDIICEWCQYFDTDPPTCLAIYQLQDKFNETGSVVNALHPGQPSVCTEENLTTVAETYAKSPKKSLHHGSAEIDIKQTST